MEIILVVVVAYLLGSIPSAFLAGRMRGVDIRNVGSGNVGATNALRAFGKKVGFAVFAADFFKGVLAVWLAWSLAWGIVLTLWYFYEAIFLEANLGPSLWGYLCYASSYLHEELYHKIAAAIAVMLGHIFPVWLKFKGGKGVATAAGVLCVLFPWPVLAVAVVVWVAVFYTTRYVSLASIALAASLPVTAALLAWRGHCPWVLAAFAALIAALAIWTHRSNINRLLAGTESHFERKKP